MPDFEAIKFEIADSIAKITLNRPEAANVMNATLVKELARAAHHCDSICYCPSSDT
jgi:2-(1,2-epoxy-1,2-dihydrophenyl)acetyl-CoA isomerase